MSIEFSRPYVLLLIPLIIALLIFSIRFLYIKSKSQKISYIVIRAIIATLLVLALSGLNIKLKDKYTATVFLVDVSDSVKDSRSDMITFVNDAIKSKNNYDSVGVVAFGDSAAVEQFLSETPLFSEIQTNVVKSATNLENAVLTGLGLIPEGYAGRIVLLTDGIENEGTLKNTIASVCLSKCAVEVKTFESDSSAEVYVSDLKIPEDVKSGEPFYIYVTIESNVAANVTVTLYQGRTMKERLTDVAVQPGSNTFRFTDTQSDEGLKTYRVTIECPEDSDTYTVNNEYLAYTNISIQKPILVVEGMSGESSEFVKILDSLGLKYEVVMPVAVPNDISGLNEFSAIVFVDVYAKDLRDGFLDNLESYVKDFGGGFVATGGKNAFALGGYKGTSIETVLPVNMEPNGENEIPTMAIAMVIDHSGSMSDGNGVITNLDLAKESAIAALNNLRDSDYVEVIAFDDSYDRVVKLQKASDKTSITNKISQIQIEGGTSIYPALKAAAEDLEKNDATIKHIILLTDGEDGYEYQNYISLLKQISADNITLSTLSIGEYCNSSLLEQLAEYCEGRYYHTDINTDIPKIFAQEIYLSVNSYLVNRNFTPVITSSDQIIKNVVTNGLPELLGYVATSAKSRATQLLVSDSDDPILCYWQYGLGKTVAWTTDVTNTWTANYAGWTNYQQLWHNILEYITTQNVTEDASAEVTESGSEATISYTSKNSDASTTVVATIADDLGNISEIELDPTDLHNFTASFDMGENGVYSINIKEYSDGELVGSLNTAAVLQYSLEYRFYEDTEALTEFVTAVGGSFIEEAAEVFNEQLDLVKKQKDMATPLLITALVLFILDVFIRRFRVNLPALASKLTGKIKPRRTATAKPAAAQATASAKAVQTVSKGSAAPTPVSAAAPAAATAATSATASVPESTPEPEKSKAKAKSAKEAKKPEKKAEPERLNTSELMKNLRR